MVNLRDIAIRADVSISTVSKVLNDKNSIVPISTETRKRVLRIAKELCYEPNIYARSLKTKKSNFIGVIVWDIMDPFFGMILSGIRKILEEANYHLILKSNERDLTRDSECIAEFNRILVGGILLVGGPKRTSKLIKQGLNIHKKSLVIIGTETDDDQIFTVQVDNNRCGFIGAEYLIKLNRPHLAFITLKTRTVDEEKRLIGFKAALKQYELPNSRNTVYEAYAGEEGGYRAAKQILETIKPPLSIFASDDLMAIGVIRALRDMGLKIPRDVALLGCDNLVISNYTEPRLSTIDQPRFDIGKRGAKLLLSILDGKSTEGQDEHIILEPSLLVRESTE